MVVSIVMIMRMRGLLDVSIGTVKHKRGTDPGAVNFYCFFFNMLVDRRELKAISRTVGDLLVTILLCH